MEPSSLQSFKATQNFRKSEDLCENIKRDPWSHTQEEPALIEQRVS
jgi:hypothetical protein